MSDPNQFPAEAVDPKLIEDTLQAVRDRPPPSDPSSAGCLVAVVAIISLVLIPLVISAGRIPEGVLLTVAVVLVVVAVVGGLVGLFGGGFASGAIIGDVESAIEELRAAYPDGDPEVLRDKAVRILDQSVVSRGPTAVAAFDREEVAEQLGDALPYVIEVERVLLARDQIYPCFTWEEVFEADGDGRPTDVDPESDG